MLRKRPDSLPNFAFWHFMGLIFKVDKIHKSRLASFFHLYDFGTVLGVKTVHVLSFIIKALKPFRVSELVFQSRKR